MALKDLSYTSILIKTFVISASSVITPFETVEELDDYLLSINVSLDLAIIFDEDTAKVSDLFLLIDQHECFHSKKRFFSCGSSLLFVIIFYKSRS